MDLNLFFTLFITKTSLMLQTDTLSLPLHSITVRVGEWGRSSSGAKFFVKDEFYVYYFNFKFPVAIDGLMLVITIDEPED